MGLLLVGWVLLRVFCSGFFYEAVRDVHINSFFKSLKPGCLTLLHKRDYWRTLTHINVLRNLLSKGLIYLVLKSRD